MKSILLFFTAICLTLGLQAQLIIKSHSAKYSQNGIYKTHEDFINNRISDEGSVFWVDLKKMKLKIDDGYTKVKCKDFDGWGVVINGAIYKVDKKYNIFLAVLAHGPFMLYGKNVEINEVDEYGYAVEITYEGYLYTFAEIDGELLFKADEVSNALSRSGNAEALAIFNKNKNFAGAQYNHNVYMEAARVYNKPTKRYD